VTDEQPVHSASKVTIRPHSPEVGVSLYRSARVGGAVGEEHWRLRDALKCSSSRINWLHCSSFLARDPS
jgi:hypothetical protein